MSKSDPFESLGNEALVEIAYDVQVQLEKGTAKGMRPVLWLLVQQRKRAASAMAKMVDIDVTEQEALRAAQNEVRLYGDLVGHCRALFSKGKDSIQQINEADRFEMEEIVGKMEPEEQSAYNLRRTED